MLATSIFVFLSLSSTGLGWEWGKSGKWSNKQRTTCHGGESTINYTSIAGFFQQDDSSTVAKTFDYTTSNYGLINRTYPTDDEFDPANKKTQWERFAYYVNTLNRDCDKNTQYKVLFMARHGEGYHNAAESYYGTPAWNCYWGPLEGNGTVTWRDARLTDAGIAQCTKANAFWKNALAVEKIPAPQSLDLPADRPFMPTIKEYFREGISMRTCDERSNKTYIHSLLPGFKFEEGFTEDDELWKGYEGETSDAQLKRTRAVLDDIFSNDDNTWISITSHSGQISTNLKVLNHIAFSLSTGQAIPALIKAQNLRKVESATTTVQSWTAEATCNAPPVTTAATATTTAV
ncbi:hypothetical protein ABKA04_005886 [Annulohypoxylon sp. FPYF3050]